MQIRPKGSNADEWHLFLCQYLDNRATSPNGLTFVAVQISEAIERAERISFDKGYTKANTELECNMTEHIKQITPQDFAKAVNDAFDRMGWENNAAAVISVIVTSLQEHFPTYLWTIHKGKIKIEELS
jgi:restriction endonuclease Mrr